MRYRNLVSRVTSRWTSENRELRRLEALPRGTRVTTKLLVKPSLETFDGASLAAQYRQIFKREAFAFHAPCSAVRILDCGANIGMFTIYCRRRYPESRIIAFEPDPTVFALLARNTDVCCGGSGINLIAAAVTHDSLSEKTFFSDHCDAGRLDVDLAGADSMPVKCVRLRDYLQEGCDLLKLDIEGAEVDVLHDCKDLLPRVANIFVEYHSFAGRKQRLGQVLQILEEAGFRVHVHAGKTSPRPFICIDEFLGMDMQLDVWGVRKTA